MSAAGTYRGTPKGRAQSGLDSPSNIPIPRPKLETSQSEASTSFSASRAKQSKRDEVWEEITVSRLQLLTQCIGNQEQAGEGLCEEANPGSTK